MPQEHLDGTVRPSLAAQCSALTEALRQDMPDCTFLQPQGGYFVWLKLPDKVRARLQVTEA